MFGWGSKKEPAKEPTLCEKLVAATKKTRSDLSARIAETTSNAQRVSLTTLSEHAQTSTKAVCTLNFEDPKFTSKINGFDDMKVEEKLQIVSDTRQYIEDGGVKAFLTGLIITAEWPVDMASQKTEEVVGDSQDTTPSSKNE